MSSIVFEDFFSDVGVWNEASIQQLEYLFTDLQRITMTCFCSRMGHSVFILNVVEEICMHWVQHCEKRSILPTSCFTWDSQFPTHSFRYFSTMNRNIIVHWQEEGILSFPRCFRERDQSLRCHTCELCSAQNNPHEKKKSCSLPQGILLFFELNHRCSHQDQIGNNNIQWQHSNKNRFRFQQQ